MNFKLNTRVAFSATTGAKPPLSKGWLFVILVGLFLPHWSNFYQHINESIAPDLLLRTIGSRLQEAGKPIYEYKWQPGDPVGWLNPYPDKRIGLNGVVSTPFFLWLLQPFARLDYCTIKTSWGIFQQALLFASLWLCCLTFVTRLRQMLFIGIATLFFIYSRNWLINLYNGQVYVIHAFVFSLAGYIATRYKNSLSASILFVLMSPIRPFFITAILPFSHFQKKKIFYLAFAIVSIATIVALTTSVTEWKQYSHAMIMYSQEATGELKMDTASSVHLQKIGEQCTINPNETFKVFGAGCLFSLQHYLNLFGIRISNVYFYQAILAATLLFLWWFAYNRKWLDDLPKQLLLAFVFYQLCELITPASRNPYNMIQWLPAVAWLFIWGDKKVVFLLVMGLCLNHDVPFRFSYAREIGEMIMFFAVASFLFKQRDRLILG